MLLAAVSLLITPSGAQTPSRWGKSYFPDVQLVTQDGKAVRFYDDLIKDKVFVVSFLYTTCQDFCPLAAARLSELQEKLGDAMGRDIYFYSISVDPETDTPERLKDYAKTFRAGPGWLFLTGKPEDVQAIRYKLGDRAKTLSQHRNEVLLGNGATGQWARNSLMGDLGSLAVAVRSMDPRWRPELRAGHKTPKPVMWDFAARPGEALFKRLCTGCHSIGEGDRVGPDLAGVAERRDRAWLHKFITNPERMRRDLDPVAVALMARFPTVRMPRLSVAEKDADDLLAYIALREDEARRAHPLNSLVGLTTHSGTKFALEDLKGMPTAVFFGFTHCPDVCPTTLMDWSNVLEDLGENGNRLKVLFVSVDSERDTAPALAEYLGSFDPRITALTGKAEDIAKAARAFGALYEKVQGSNGNYTFDHTTNVYLVGRDGRVAAKVNLQTPEADRRQVLAKLLARP
ncbi:MAG TPA: SCO family protein [Hyphomicrobiaceae bacterium]|nr:SCO family protein [Hyphomicrobiaceae bacterium]